MPNCTLDLRNVSPGDLVEHSTVSVVADVPTARVSAKKPCPSANVTGFAATRDQATALWMLVDALKLLVENRPGPLGSKLHPDPPKRPWILVVH